MDRRNVILLYVLTFLVAFIMMVGAAKSSPEDIIDQIEEREEQS